MNFFRIIATGLLSTALLSQPAMAQTSVAQRVQQLAKLEEDLNSPDSNVQLAAFEAAMESGSLATRQKAISLARISSNADLRNLAMRFVFCGKSRVNIIHGYVQSDFNFDRFKTKNSSITITSCSVATGLFRVRLVSGETSENLGQPGTGEMSARSVSFSFPVGSGNGEGVCTVWMTLDKEADLSGQMSCQVGGRTFGPVAASILL